MTRPAPTRRRPDREPPAPPAVRTLLRHKARRDLGRQPAQVLAVAATVFLGIVLFVADLDASLDLSRSYDSFYERTAMADLWITGGDTVALVDELAADPRVAVVEDRVHADVPLRLAGRELLGRVEGATDAVVTRHLMAGRDLEPGDTDVVVLERHAADEFGLGPGDTVDVFVDGDWTPVTVVGVAASPEYLFPSRSRSDIFALPDEFAVVFAPDTLARRLAPDAERQIVARFVPGGDTAAVVAAHRDRAHALGAREVYGLDEQPSNLALQSDVEGFASISVLFPVLFLSVAGMAAYVMLGRLVRRERHEIGTLFANGIDRRSVVRHYMSHGLAICALGGVPGVVVGVLLGRWMAGLYTGYLDIPVTVVGLHPVSIVVALVFVVVTGVVAAGLPARAAARIEPAEAMRPPTPDGVDERSLAERLVPFRLPVGARYVARNLTRSRRRALTTAVGIVGALVVLITSLALNDTVAHVLDRYFGGVDRRDLTVHLDHAVTDADLAGLAADPRIAVAEPVVEAPVVLSTPAGRSDQTLLVMASDTALHGFDRPLPPDGIVVGHVAVTDLGVGPGDRVEITVPGTGVSATVPVAATVDEALPSISYVSLDAWRALGAPEPTAVSVVLVDDDAHDEVRADLVARDDSVAVTDHVALARYLRDLMRLSIAFVGIMVVFAVVMAVALLFNVVTVTIAERTGEVATLMASGAGRGFVRSVLTAENLAVVVAGIVPGVVAGVVVARIFLAQFDTEAFRFRLVLTGGSLALAVGLVVVGALVAQIPGLRALDRLDLAAVVRERSI